MSLGHPHIHHASVGSTNDVARELADDGAEHGTLVTADEQTAGRGRYAREWITPPGTALAASLVLHEFDPLLPLRAGLAVADVAGEHAQVKWPNDVWLDGRKVAGILVEAREWAILGIGVNVAVDLETLPPDLRETAGTLGRAPDELEATLTELLAALERRLAQSSDEIVDALRERDALLGREILWDGGEGTADGIDANGQLLVLLHDGTVRALGAGEVTVRPA